jgi:hypothetical protein
MTSGILYKNRIETGHSLSDICIVYVSILRRMICTVYTHCYDETRVPQNPRPERLPTPIHRCHDPHRGNTKNESNHISFYL